MHKFRSAIVVFLFLLSRCGASHVESTDAGYDVKAPPYDSGSDNDSGPCGPIDVSDYKPEQMHPPNPPHAGVCTTQESMDYASCEGGDTSKCMQFGTGQPAEQCGACIETQKTDKTWGAVVFDGSLGTPNSEGCVDDALAQVKAEGANGGTGSCGDLLHASYGCQADACDACSGSAAVTCVETAIQNQCSVYDVEVENPTGPCQVLFDDATPPDVRSCFADQTITDVAAQQADFLTRITEYMCGN